MCAKATLLPAGLDVNGGPLAAGVVSNAAIPVANDPSWVDMGVIEEWEDELKDEEKETWAPSPGHLVRSRVIVTKQSLTCKLTTNQLTALAVETFYRSAALTPASFQFNPLSNVPKDGFMKIATVLGRGHPDPLGRSVVPAQSHRRDQGRRREPDHAAVPGGGPGLGAELDGDGRGLGPGPNSADATKQKS